MKKTLSIIGGTLLLSLFLLLTLAPINQTFAVPENTACVASGTYDGGCDSGLYCDISKSNDCTSVYCTGICHRRCTITPGGSASGNCPNQQYCDMTGSSSCTGSACGFCRSITVQPIGRGGNCQTQSPSDRQGNCVEKHFCNTSANKSCSGTVGGCSGVCFPDTYQCRRTDYSLHFSCPVGFSCNPDSMCQLNFWHPDCKCSPSQDLAVSCTCTMPGYARSGQNGFTCTRGSETKPFFCQTVNHACWNDANHKESRSSVFGGSPATGVRCNTIEENKKITGNIAPPTPPCTSKDSSGRCLGLNSSLGFLSTEPKAFVLSVFGILLAASGGIGVIIFARAGYQIMTARGNQEGLQKGREQMIAATVGLIFLIFSLVLLQTLGVDILRIPGFGNALP